MDLWPEEEGPPFTFWAHKEEDKLDQEQEEDEVKEW